MNSEQKLNKKDTKFNNPSTFGTSHRKANFQKKILRFEFIYRLNKSYPLIFLFPLYARRMSYENNKT